MAFDGFHEPEQLTQSSDCNSKMLMVAVDGSINANQRYTDDYYQIRGYVILALVFLLWWFIFHIYADYYENFTLGVEFQSQMSYGSVHFFTNLYHQRILFQNRDAASTEECTAYIYLLNISDLCKRDETFVDIRLAMSGATLTAIIQIGRSLRFVLS